ncbi:uncharacterized protein [Cicer arietinum]|uniref:Uncharacterized protein LOC101507912 n=1 Tax=Cicer arietinum TaxID=3827 RepID=A0A1S2Z8F6_CICAR|nr:uncharacterized protein LOC101507912 [Cicer arietinum]
MSSYAKFLKEILSNKIKLDDNETFALTKEYSAIIQNKLPPKLKDPGSFSIPCVIGDMSFEHVLCGLGASASLMPLSVCNKLDVGELKPTKISLQLVDRSIMYLVAILEDVHIKVGQFFIPVDFLVLEIEDDSQVPILLGRSFLATAGAIIDVKLVFNVGDENIEFNLSNLMKSPSLEDSYYRVGLIVHCVRDYPLGPLSQDGLEACLIGSTSHEDLVKEADAYANLLDENPPLPNLNFEAIAAENSTPLPKEAPQVELKPLPSNLRLKEALISAPIMQPPDWSLLFEIVCNAIDFVVGAVLGQRKEKKVHAIYYASGALDVKLTMPQPKKSYWQ